MDFAYQLQRVVFNTKRSKCCLQGVLKVPFFTSAVSLTMLELTIIEPILETVVWHTYNMLHPSELGRHQTYGCFRGLL